MSTSFRVIASVGNPHGTDTGPPQPKTAAHWGWRRKAKQIRLEEKDILDGFGMRKLPLTSAEELIELIMRRYERAGVLVTSTGGDLGQVAGRFRGCQRHARPPPAQGTFAEARPPKLAN